MRGEVFRGGDMPPFGVRAFEGFEPNDLVLYVERRRALVVGDTLIDRGNGLQVHPDWPGPGIAADEVIYRLRPLLDRVPRGVRCARRATSPWPAPLRG